jgi:hypothetical protein
MGPSLDIFAAGNFDPLWLGSAETLAQAVELMKNNGEGVYFIFSQKNMEKSFYKVKGDMISVVEPV